MKKLVINLTIPLLVLLSCGSVSDDSGQRPPGTTEPDPDDPEYVLKDAPFPVGAAVTPGYLSGSTEYLAVLKRDFNSLTAENAMKMNAMSTARGQYNFTQADNIVSVARENDMRVHGHTLIWYREDALPSWVRNFSGSREDWIEMMQEYITDVVTHFKGNVKSWDVVNEALEDDGTWRGGVWYDNIGPEYVELAFRAAHAADPDAILFYNDFGMEYSTVKRQAICDLVNNLKTAGVPVHGIGIQMHITINTTNTAMLEAIKAASDCEVWVHVSELDVAVNPYDQPVEYTEFTASLAARQAESYRNVFEAMKSIPTGRQYGITMWGVHDPSSWLSGNPDWPLLFDAEFKEKPAYEAVLETFAE